MTDVPIEFINTTIKPCDCTSCDVLEHHTDPQLRRLTCLLSLSIRQLAHVIALVVIQGVITMVGILASCSQPLVISIFAFAYSVNVHPFLSG